LRAAATQYMMTSRKKLEVTQMARTRASFIPLSAAFFGMAAIAATPTIAKASACTSLTSANVIFPGKATVVTFSAQDVAASPPVPAFCDVYLVASSNGNPAQSQIAIEVWLPETGWNGRFLGTGNGGFAGSISTSALELSVIEGFAAANTDMGTGLLFQCNSLYCGNHTGYGGIPGGLYKDSAAIEDFGYGATHLMTIAGKQLTAAYFGAAASYNYFAGCSTGGQQAMMESQRFPKDYNGILTGDPAQNRTHLHMSGPAVYEATHFAADAYLTDAGLALVHAKVLKQCAGHDGGLRTDDFLTLPNSCATDAHVLQCTGAEGEVPCTDPNAASCTCLTHDQTLAMNQDWIGAEDDHGRTLYPGNERGSEEPVALNQGNDYIGNLGLVWQQAGTEPVFDSLMFWALGPNWVWQEMFDTTSTLQPELAAEIKTIDDTKVGNSTFENVLNATNTDLSPFAANGGKMLMYHGYADPLIPSATSFDYYNAVAHADRTNVSDYLRLFMVPGLWHCSGGPGANDFGGFGQLAPIPLDPTDDALGALIAWVEQGNAPTRITATKYVNDNPADGIAFQRPLCLYPQHSAYTHGDKTSAASYACAASKPVTNQKFSPIYGP
jgi:feruloyl esterase